MATDLLATF